MEWVWVWVVFQPCCVSSFFYMEKWCLVLILSFLYYFLMVNTIIIIFYCVMCMLCESFGILDLCSSFERWYFILFYCLVQFSSVAQSCLTPCDPMDYSMPGFPVLHHLLQLAQTHVCWVGYAIQPSHPLSFPSPAFNLSQHQGLFQWVGTSGHQSIGASSSASVHVMNIQG